MERMWKDYQISYSFHILREASGVGPQISLNETKRRPTLGFRLSRDIKTKTKMHYSTFLIEGVSFFTVPRGRYDKKTAPFFEEKPVLLSILLT